MKRARMATVFLIVLMVISFGGCSWFSSSSSGSAGSGGSGGGAYDPNDKINGSVPLPENKPGIDYDDSLLERDLALSMAEETQGVRATYVPVVNEKSDDPILQDDRDTYLKNAAFQYEIVATYILHTLEGKYGAGVGADSIEYQFYSQKSITGTFYEGKEIRNKEDRESQTIDLPALAPEAHERSETLGTNEDAINNPVVDVDLEYYVATPNGNTECPPRKVVTDSSYAWKMNGQDIVGEHKSIVQLNLMELALGLTLTSFGTDETTCQKEIQNLAKDITKLGIKEKQSYRDQVFDYIKDNIIGSKAYNRESATISYDDPEYKYYLWEIVGYRTVSDGNGGTHQEPIYDWVEYTGYYDMHTGKGHSFTDSEIYKFKYEETITEIVEAILGTYADENTLLTEGFVHTFPKYTRVEIADMQTLNFFYSPEPEEPSEGEEPERRVITSMDYREYNSVIIYPNVYQKVVKEEEEEEQALSSELFLPLKERGSGGQADTRGDMMMNQGAGLFASEEEEAEPDIKNWLMNIVSISIDSMNDLTIDVYMRIHLGSVKDDRGNVITPAQQMILHITRFNTDKTKGYDYYGEEDEDEDYEVEIDEEGNLIFPEDKMTPEERKALYFNTEKKMNNVSVDLEHITNDKEFIAYNGQINNKYRIDDPSADEFRQFFGEPVKYDEEGKYIPDEEGFVSHHNVFAGKLGSNLNIDTPKHLEYSLSIQNYYGETVSFDEKYLCQEDVDFVEFIFDVKKDQGKDYDYSFKFTLEQTYLVWDPDDDFNYDELFPDGWTDDLFKPDDEA